MTTWQEQKRRDLAELAGADEPPKRRPGRPRKNESPQPEATVKRRPGRPRKADADLARPRKAAEKRLDEAIEDEDDGGFSTSSRDLYKVVNGVSVQWLARAFGMTRHNIEKRIRGCRVVGSGDYGNPLYDLRDAAAYLVEPKFDLEEYLSKIKPDRLPEKFRESFWNAKLKEQRWRRAAGELWDTEQVMTVFSEVLADIRDKLQLIPDTVERLGGLDVKQWQMVRNLVDQAQDEIHGHIVRFASRDDTLNQLGDEEREVEEDLA